MISELFVSFLTSGDGSLFYFIFCGTKGFSRFFLRYALFVLHVQYLFCPGFSFVSLIPFQRCKIGCGVGDSIFLMSGYLF